MAAKDDDDDDDVEGDVSSPLTPDEEERRAMTFPGILTSYADFVCWCSTSPATLIDYR